MHWLFRIPIYLGYTVSIGGLIAHFTGWNFLAVIQLDQGMASGVTGLLLSMSYLYLFGRTHPTKETRESETKRE